VGRGPAAEDRIDPLPRRPIDVVGVPGGMQAKIRARAGFPARMQRWCTRELKINPLRGYHMLIGEDTVSALGIRADESPSRAAMAEIDVHAAAAELAADGRWCRPDMTDRADFAVAAARALWRASPDAVFQFISGKSTRLDSRYMWARVKGETERDLLADGHPVNCWRPAAIDGPPARGAELLAPPCWAAPVVAHGYLYVRGQGRLVCLDLLSP
jgi:hypothetical protein